MIYEIISMNGYGIYVWSAFIFTLIGFATLYAIIKLQLVKEEERFKSKVKSLSSEKIKVVKKQQTYKEVLAYTSISKI